MKNDTNIKDHMDALKKCILFQNIEEDEIKAIFHVISPKTVTYSKNQAIAIEGDECSSIGIILEGKIEIQKMFLSGKSLTINKLSEGDIFGEVIVFSALKEYPSTIMSASNSVILFISKADISKIFSINAEVLNNFMGLLSSKILMLNNKIRTLSFETLREKICSCLMDEYQKQKNKKITLPFSRKEMAEYLGVQRPSLSREFINMKNEGLIDFDRNHVTLLDVDAIEEYLY